MEVKKKYSVRYLRDEKLNFCMEVTREGCGRLFWKDYPFRYENAEIIFDEVGYGTTADILKIYRSMQNIQNTLLKNRVKHHYDTRNYKACL